MRVPLDLREAIGRSESILSLRTKDPKEAIAKAPAAIAKLRAEFNAARAASGPPRRMTHREILEQAGIWYRETVRNWEEDPGPPEGWEAWEGLLFSELEKDQAGEIVGFLPKARDLAEAKQILAEKGISADPDSLRRSALALFDAKRKAAAILTARAEGDFSPDPNASAFPKEEAAKNGPPLAAESLLAAWETERRPAAKTREKYSGTFRNIARVLGFDDLRRITPDDVLTFKRHRLEVEKRHPGTVEDDIRNAGAVCKWGVRNRFLPSNPFDGLAPKAPRTLASREPYNDDEARHILSASREEKGWLRWGPWLLCFTGARIGELAELRRKDVREENGVSFLDIRPHEARPGKNATMQRMIPLHPAVLAERFLTYVTTLPDNPDGPLFPCIPPDPRGKRDTTAQARLGRWTRGKLGLKDQKKAPAHSWRHRMEDELRKVGAHPEMMDAITGRHNPRNAGAGYGKGYRGMPSEVLKVLRRIPSPLAKEAQAGRETTKGRRRR
jgi:integrase